MQENNQNIQDQVDAIECLAEAAGMNAFERLGHDAEPEDIVDAAYDTYDGERKQMSHFLAGFNTARRNNGLEEIDFRDLY